MALLDSDGPIDTVASLFGFVFTTAWYLAFGLGVEFAKNLLPGLMTCFGLLDAGGDITFSKGPAVAGGAAYALAGVALMLPKLLGTETASGRHSHQTFGFWVWLGWTIYHVKYWMSDDPVSGTPANYFWIGVNLFMVYCHYQWVGNDVLAKLKLA